VNKKILILIIVLLVVFGGYFLLKGSPQTEVLRNPEGVTNEEVESSNYRLYSPAEYEKAKAEGRVIMLYFTANWCPICREQEPVNMAALTELSGDKEIVAFRIHILDWPMNLPSGTSTPQLFLIRQEVLPVPRLAL